MKAIAFLLIQEQYALCPLRLCHYFTYLQCNLCPMRISKSISYTLYVLLGFFFSSIVCNTEWDHTAQGVILSLLSLSPQKFPLCTSTVSVLRIPSCV